MGDRDASAVGVTPNPTVTEIDLSSLKGKHAFVVSVTDGLFDVLSLQDIANELAFRLFATEGKAPDSLKTACQHLLRRASKEWLNSFPIDDPYRDDITIAVHRL